MAWSLVYLGTNGEVTKGGRTYAKAYLCGSAPVQNFLLEPHTDEGTPLARLQRGVRRRGRVEGVRQEDFGRRRFGLGGVPVTPSLDEALASLMLVPPPETRLSAED